MYYINISIIMHIVNDVWIYIKTFLFHNIKTQGKHLKNDLNIKNYNQTIKIFNNILKETSNPRIIMGSLRYNSRIVKFIYEIKYKNIRRIVLLYQKYKVPGPNYMELRREYDLILEN